jgi:hypothetical protein
MEMSLRNLVEKVGLPEERARKLVEGNPRRVMGEG